MTDGGAGWTIGAISYANVLPFYAGNTFDGYACLAEVPRVLGDYLRTGRIAAAPIAVVDLWRFRDTVVPLGEFGIASTGAVSSVLLFTRAEPDALGGVPVRVTGESSTSVRLLWVLLKERWGIDTPVVERFDGDPGAADPAFLLIGVRALAHRARLAAAGYRVTDLAEAWHAHTGHPCVFAQWAVHTGVDAATREDILARLERALERNLPDLDGLYDPAHGGPFADAQALGAYLRQFTYRFGRAERRAIALFHEKVEAHDLIDRPL